MIWWESSASTGCTWDVIPVNKQPLRKCSEQQIANSTRQTSEHRQKSRRDLISLVWRLSCGNQQSHVHICCAVFTVQPPRLNAIIALLHHYPDKVSCALKKPSIQATQTGKCLHHSDTCFSHKFSWMISLCCQPGTLVRQMTLACGTCCCVFVSSQHNYLR